MRKFVRNIVDVGYFNICFRFLFFFYVLRYFYRDFYVSDTKNVQA